jgi:glutathione peroxidase
MAEFSRRLFLATVGVAVMTQAEATETLAWQFGFPEIDDVGRVEFSKFKGRVLLVANTASFCGYTYQYDALEKLHTQKSLAGLTVIGVPSQDFDQEAGSNGEVKTFCETRFGIDFPLAALSHVRGPKANPFHAWVRQMTKWEPAWNFNKVLIGRDGRIVATFGSTDEPDGELIQAQIAMALARSV